MYRWTLTSHRTSHMPCSGRAGKMVSRSSDRKTRFPRYIIAVVIWCSCFSYSTCRCNSTDPVHNDNLFGYRAGQVATTRQQNRDTELVQVLHRAARAERSDAPGYLATALHHWEQVGLGYDRVELMTVRFSFILQSLYVRGHATVPVINDALQEWVAQFKVGPYSFTFTDK